MWRHSIQRTLVLWGFAHYSMCLCTGTLRTWCFPHWSSHRTMGSFRGACVSLRELSTNLHKHTARGASGNSIQYRGLWVSHRIQSNMIPPNSLLPHGGQQFLHTQKYWWSIIIKIIFTMWYIDEEGKVCEWCVWGKIHPAFFNEQACVSDTCSHDVHKCVVRLYVWKQNQKLLKMLEVHAKFDRSVAIK